MFYEMFHSVGGGFKFMADVVSMVCEAGDKGIPCFSYIKVFLTQVAFDEINTIRVF